MSGANRQFKRLSVLMAAYNEEASMRRCLERVMGAPLPAGLEREIVVVDDASRDETLRIAQSMAAAHPEIRVLHQERNQGKGAALRRAIGAMTGDLAIFQDADLEYDPGDYPRLLKPILDGRADVVYGSRFTGEERKVLYFWHTVGNRVLTLLSNMLNDINLTDMETCYKAFAADCLKAMPLESNRFGIEPEITAKVARNRFRIFEVPVSYSGRTYDAGKKISWRDGMAALWFIVKYRFSSNYSDSGKVSLDAIEQAPRFNRWMYASIEPYLGRRVAELGSGRGNLTRLLKDRRVLLATDMRQDYLDKLEERWGGHSGFQVARLDLTRENDYAALQRFAPETVVCLNVLEHIEDDRRVLARLHEVLPPGARIVFLVPFNPKLMSEFDRQIGHFRRYDKGELEGKMTGAGFAVERQFFFNKAGVFAWWVGNTLSGQHSLQPWQLKLYNFLTPIFRPMDRVLPTNGLSTIVVARKPSA